MHWSVIFWIFVKALRFVLFQWVTSKPKLFEIIKMTILVAQNNLPCKMKEISIIKAECIYKKFETLYEFNLSCLIWYKILNKGQNHPKPFFMEKYRLDLPIGALSSWLYPTSTVIILFDEYIYFHILYW